MTFKLHHYAGWVEAPESDAMLLIELGMRGPMIYNGKQFEHCHVPDDATMKALIENYPGFWPNAFSAIDADGNQPDSSGQTWWGYRPKEKMLTFDRAYEFTQTIGSHTSFEKEECAAYFGILMSLPLFSRIVEVGLEYGRSSSIALQVARELNFEYAGIDPFEDKPEVYESWLQTTQPFFQRKLYRVRSDDYKIADNVLCVLIDGDHSYEGVLGDCEHFLPYVADGGYAMFHDYLRESLPDVTRAIEAYIRDHAEQWEAVDVVGTLGIWRKR